MAFNLELYKLVYPKWAAARFELGPDDGKLTFIISPSLTPGSLPSGIKPGVIPKGTKVFDYKNEIGIALSISECLRIMDFAKLQNLADSVDLIHTFKGTTKKIMMAWSAGKSGDAEVCNVNLTSSTGEDKKKVFVPIPFSGMREIVTILDSYIKNYALLKALCMSGVVKNPFVGKGKISEPSDFAKADELPDFEEEL